jgi:EAL domain-containing protein (putative c-di-GMP-specific phosphodiesterase class I)
LITFGQETDATIVAEGIESYQELRVLQDLGVTLGQGYYLAPQLLCRWRLPPSPP